jgi:hypothetical protein
MSVPEGTLTDEYREHLLEFYGGMLGWKEMEELRLPDRLTISIGGPAYLNLRERPDSMVTHGYEHFGLLVGSAAELRSLWDRLDAASEDVDLEPMTTSDRGGSWFRFRYLLPMAVEVQFFPDLA